MNRIPANPFRKSESKSVASEPIQRTANKTGMPDNLKSGLENLSGYDLSHVRVHFNSSRPAQLNAMAYAQGSDIHVGPGHEKHLPHEGWHIVQQLQGRVKPTAQLKTDIPVNTDKKLEKEAEKMGKKAIQKKTEEKSEGCNCSASDDKKKQGPK